MALETGTFVDDLVVTNPVAADSVSQGDDHLRLIKSLLKTTFPNATKALYFPNWVAAKTGAYTVVAADDHKLIPGDAASVGAFSMTMTAVASLPAGFVCTIMKVDAGSNAVTVDGASTETINGATTYTLDTQYQAVTLLNTGTEWLVIGVGSVFDLTNIVLTGTLAQFNAALSDGSFASLAGSEVLSGKTLAAATLSGLLSAADQIIDQAVLRDYAEEINALGSLGGGTDDIDLELANVVSATVDTSTETFTFSNPPTSGKAGSFTLILTNGGSQTVNWPASVDWNGGTAPTLTVSGIDVLTFFTLDGGTIWYGFVSGQAMA